MSTKKLGTGSSLSMARKSDWMRWLASEVSEGLIACDHHDGEMADDAILDALRICLAYLAQLSPSRRAQAHAFFLASQEALGRDTQTPIQAALTGALAGCQLPGAEQEADRLLGARRAKLGR